MDKYVISIQIGDRLDIKYYFCDFVNPEKSSAWNSFLTPKSVSFDDALYIIMSAKNSRYFWKFSLQRN